MRASSKGSGPTVALDTSTVDPRAIAHVGDAVDATGAGFLDCPVSGSVSVVEAGTLTIMVGGEAICWSGCDPCSTRWPRA